MNVAAAIGQMAEDVESLEQVGGELQCTLIDLGRFLLFTYFFSIA